MISLIVCILLLMRISILDNKIAGLTAEMGNTSDTHESDISAGTGVSDSNMNGGVSESINAAEGTAAENKTEAASEEAAESQTESEPVTDTAASSDVKRAYITFDDGPSIYTLKILNILKEHNVRATFFVDGAGDGNEETEDMYAAIVNDGNTIAMHSYSHRYSEIYDSEETFTNDLDKIHSLIYNKTGVDSKMYRFPGGSGNAVSKLDMSVFIGILHDRGYEYWDWNVYPGDPEGTDLSAAEITANTLRGVDLRNTPIILLHDTGAKETTVEALPDIIEGMLDRNIEILPMDSETPIVQQSAVN